MIKRVLCASMVLVFMCAGGALAGKNGGGAMLVHANDTLVYSPGDDYCAFDLGVTDCAGVVTRTDKDPNVESMIWFLGVFDPSTSPGVTAFQVGVYGDITPDWISAKAPCGPGVLEIPDATWPAPGTGTACAFSSAVTDKVFKMYWFATGAPAVGSGMTTGHYPGGDGQAEFADDSQPAIIDVVTKFGTVRWGADGDKTCPTPPAQGACCIQSWWKCEVVLENQCIADGGIYLGDNSICDASNACSACCYTDVANFRRNCAVVPEWYCLQHYSDSGSGGLYADPAWSGLKQDGTGHLCAPGADSSAVEWWCDVPGTATKPTSWGKLKSLFR